MGEGLGPVATVEELRDLADKYRRLATLRVRRDAGGSRTTKATLRALAAQFPGALRELDTLGLAELQRRAAAAERAAEGGSREPWMDWIAAYHALMKMGLELKRGARSPGVEGPSVADARPGLEMREGLDEEALHAMQRPPGGRLSPLILQLVARQFGVPAPTVAATLFPTRRPSPYTL